jgi:6-phosphogluconate dehydrogenase
MMIGGEPDRAASRSDLRALAPGRATSRARRAAPARRHGGAGLPHCGPNGAGHFVKMVHNGIEYGLMAAYAEGMNVLRGANVGCGARRRRRDHAARHPEHYRTTSTCPTSPKCGGAAA